MMATKKWAERNVKPSIKGGPAENRKAAHVKRRRKVADRANKPPGCGRRMSGKQILDIREGKARVKPRHHQPVPSQYGTWWGHGSEVRGYGLVVGEGKRPILRLLPKLFWEVRPAGMTDHPKEARLWKEPLDACHEG